MIKKYTLLALQKAINHALSLDEASLKKLSNLNGKSLELIINPLNVCFFIVFRDEKLCLLDKYEDKPDVTIHSNPIGLIRLSLLPSSKVRSLFNDKIRISGNIELGQEIKKLFDEIDIDWEGHLAELTGDVVAHQIGSFVRSGRAFKQKVKNSLSRNTSEYLHEEIREFPSREEVNDFYNEVDDLNLRTDRLSAHVNKLLVKYDSF